MEQKQFEFADFVDEFKVNFEVMVEQPGHYNNVGKWIKGEDVAKPMEGIILPLSKDELEHEPNGRYTALDRKIFTVEPLKIGQKIIYKEQTFTVDNEKPYNDYADVFIYFAKGVRG